MASMDKKIVINYKNFIQTQLRVLKGLQIGVSDISITRYDIYLKVKVFWNLKLCKGHMTITMVTRIFIETYHKKGLPELP